MKFTQEIFNMFSDLSSLNFSFAESEKNAVVGKSKIKGVTFALGFKTTTSFTQEDFSCLAGILKAHINTVIIEYIEKLDPDAMIQDFIDSMKKEDSK